MNEIMKNKGPEFVNWFGPLLEALKDLGGSGTPEEASNKIAEKEKISDDVLKQTISSGAYRFHNQVCWARQYLVWEGYIDSSVRGIWKLTEKGQNSILTNDIAYDIFSKWSKIHSANRKKKTNAVIEKEIEEEEIDDASSIFVDYKSQVLNYLRTMSPKNFERFCLYMLRVNNFENLQLTGKSHDEGIDGIGVLKINPFVSFKVLFQAKRYKDGNNISRDKIGDFRNAMIGRADKGIFITTSKFTQEAIKEANRDGAPQIELVDCDKLIKMLEVSKLGLKPITTYEVDTEFFQQYMSE